MVRDLPSLDRYRWSGHRAVLGRRQRPWQAGDEMLGHFGWTVGPARVQYRAFVGPPAPGRVAAALGITQMPVLRGIAPGRELLAARGLGAERLGRAAMR